ncbi:ASCH domain-containing protein [Leuconostoc mesenteroides]|uniref:ASCH domain-containing protein n=1 Tax=Leuconostoc mesenteroides TaxID=1245 RepID=UPI001174F78F|nr:ASCH domain-containing protein [Leuconostoc mesenteroides]MCT3045980.1 ASCH domain-containing protein [Leuconostoc mesenteroides]MCT8383645.1 ASCH domain-containing protein [Leuconostoc mesenteroides]GEK66076.1 RNA-binding protein [Leuconostoc mesenteroides subsp. sake]
MTPDELFNKAKESNIVPYAAKLQSAFQFGVSADELASLVLSGKKTATTSSLDLYDKDESLPQNGVYDAILDSKDQAVCIIQNDSVEIKNYLDVSEKHAYLEGEGDRSLQYWHNVHNDFFVNEYQLEGLIFREQDAKMVLENFHVVYPVKQ